MVGGWQAFRGKFVVKVEKKWSELVVVRESMDMKYWQFEDKEKQERILQGFSFACDPVVCSLNP